MLSFNQARIAEIERRIGELRERLDQDRAQAYATVQYGRRQGEQLGRYYEGLLQANLQTIEEELGRRLAPSVASWDDACWSNWEATEACEEELLRVGELTEPRSKDSVLLPAFVPFIGGGKTVVIRANGSTYPQGLGLLQSLVVRTALMLPHQSRYTLLDPAGAGVAFPMRRHLPLVQESSPDVRRDLDQVMAEIQRIIGDYLDAATTSFERVAPQMRVNERFHFVFAADFPNQYDRRAVEALQSVANTGTVAGVYLFILHNEDQGLPRDVRWEDFKNLHFIDLRPGQMPTVAGLTFAPDATPAPEVQQRVFEVLRQAKPPERLLDWDGVVGIDGSDWWQRSSAEIVEAPIGARGSGEPLKLWFGVNPEGQPCAHGMLGAMTGSGKSNLYHVLINGLAVRYSPEELRFYLIDGKDGVEFQPYRHLPHAEVVSLRSSAELSRSVLDDLVTEKERRNALFSRCGASDFVGYRRKGQPEGPLPRILLLVDEYQELFDGDKDGVASSYLLQLAQQGRSAGIHMFLASQRFGARGMLNQDDIFGNFHLRVAMQMTNDDIQSLTLFGRRGKVLIGTCDLPGKIVVNDRSGDDAANAAGKVAFLASEGVDQLIGTLREKAESLPVTSLPRRVIFNGQAQPQILDNPYIADLVRRPDWPTPAEMEALARQPIEEGGLGIVDWFAAEHPRAAWLGQEFSVRGQALLVLRRRAAEHAIVVGSRNPARYGLLAAMVTGLALSAPPDHNRFVIVDRSIPGTEWGPVLQQVYEQVLQPTGSVAAFVTEGPGLESTLHELVSELERRRVLSDAELAVQSSVFVILTELDRVKELQRLRGSYGLTDSPLGEQLACLYTDGAAFGIHVILSFSGVGPMRAVLDERRGLLNFRHRIALQMSEDDSHTFVRSRRAALLQAQGAKPIGALYLDVESDATARFKPYSVEREMMDPSDTLVEQLQIIGTHLAARGGRT